MIIEVESRVEAESPPHAPSPGTSPRLAVIAELDQAIPRLSMQRREKILVQMTDLFVAGANRFSDDQVDLFDAIISKLAAATDVSARSMLSLRLASISKPPAKTIGLLANDDVFTVAGPILARSEWVDQETLLRNAHSKGQDHLRAIAQRKLLPEAVSDVLVARGDKEVLRALVDNPQARLSEQTFQLLVNRSCDDDALATALGSRADIPHRLFQGLLAGASEQVRLKFAAANLPMRIEFSSFEPRFLFNENGLSLLAA